MSCKDVLGLACLAGLLLPAIADADGPAPKDDYAEVRAHLLRIQDAALENPDSTEDFDLYLSILPRSADLYVVEGDIVLTEEGVRGYLRKRAAADPQVAPGGELVVERESNGDRILLKWEERTQDYAFDVGSFPSKESLEKTIAFADQAAQAWEEACSIEECGVDFIYRADLNGEPTPGGDVDFVIRYSADLGYGILAQAFFPKDQGERRILYVAPIFFETGLSQVGVMIHEFGHILGYWHEQLLGQVEGCFVPPATQRFVDASLEALGPQDTQSPMHYPCGPVTDYADALSSRDISEHREVYGR